MDDRVVIRASKRLNDFLYHNRYFLLRIFEDAKKWDPFNPTGKLGFTMRAAREFFYHFVHQEVIQVTTR